MKLLKSAPHLPALADPRTHLIVYPQMMRQMERQWRVRARVGATP